MIIKFDGETLARDISFYLAERISQLRHKGETEENIKLFTDAFFAGYEDTLKYISKCIVKAENKPVF